MRFNSQKSEIVKLGNLPGLKPRRLPFSDLDPDGRERILWQREVIQQNPLLRQKYAEWYSFFRQRFPGFETMKLLELGSGPGFLKEFLPGIITSDVIQVEGIDLQINAEELPFGNSELDGILMCNVFHHLARPDRFLHEAQRTLKKGGQVVMIEPANTLFSRFIYGNFHPEPFNPNGLWVLSADRPMSMSNQALPYIYFKRDFRRFSEEFPNLALIRHRVHSPFSYLVSGGFSYHPLLPAGMNGIMKTVEFLSRPFFPFIGLFCTIELRKI